MVLIVRQKAEIGLSMYTMHMNLKNNNTAYIHLISRIHCISLFVENVDKRVRWMTDWLLGNQAIHVHIWKNTLKQGRI